MSEAPESWSALKAAVRELDGVLAGATERSPNDRQAQLLLALSQLEVACLGLPDLRPDEGEGQSPSTYDVRRAAIVNAFPELGYYHSTRPTPPEKASEPSVGYAVDDLADILRDLDNAIWVEAKQGWHNAIWEAKFGYEHHFGSHLADLRLYLYHLRFFGP